MEIPRIFHVVILAISMLSVLRTIGLSQALTVQQLNCSSSHRDICRDVCSEPKALPYSSTFCDAVTGSCICDCRDGLRKDCDEQPFTACFQQCVNKNPNPDVFLYEGGNCPIVDQAGLTKYQCACGCSIRDDYEETNDLN